MFIDQDSNLQARKHCMTLFSDLKIKDLNKIEEHRLSWDALCKMENRFTTTARNLLDKVTDNTGADERTSLENTVDTLTMCIGACRYEKDQRTELGSREPRAQGGSNKRPGVEPGIARNGGSGGENADTVYALEPEQRFSTWAKARENRQAEFPDLTMGQYLRSMILGGKTDVERRALSEGSDSAGGYTVPDILSAELIDLARAASVVTQAGARTVPLTSDNNIVAKLLTDPVPAWRAEAGAVAESDPTFGSVQLIPRSLAFFTKLSAELMEDSINLATELPRVMAAAMAAELDRVALLGTGTAPEPEGVANVTGIGTFAQDAVIASYANLSKARTGILTANCGPVSAYVMHPRDDGSFTDLVDSTGQPLNAPRAVSDIPTLTTTSIPVDGGGGSDESTIIAGNFGKMLVGIRSDIRVEVLKADAYATNLQYTLLAHMRADIAVTHPGAFYTLTGVGQV